MMTLRETCAVAARGQPALPPKATMANITEAVARDLILKLPLFSPLVIGGYLSKDFWIGVGIILAKH
jgi:hypothetical protein